MKFIALPSGKIINLEQVAFVTSPGIGVNQQQSDAVLLVHFAAVSYAATKFGSGGGSLHLSLAGDDITSFLSEMKALGLKTDATDSSLKKQQS
jgi:hypothetical protein